ncbi:fructosamine kinase family protein [Paraglaciecola aquimarina]|uniref:Fructosamine kinase family protein n=1 Tax=Paraglaciecola algarum TaxID=3050085 RepID=A0ABS9D1P3_9ALTE|nr:fructosamine kinase family protein [Paraglaciecola sp. G1-23]MCF2946843.1 fructosamine kinase family protein [Paraglaciecola sp. G1-23]
MWHFISEQISQNIQQEFICDDVREIPEGDSHQTFRVSDGKRRFFVKVNEKIRHTNFQAEIEGLKHLNDTELFKISKVITDGVVSDHSFLVLEYIHMQPGNSENWQVFGQLLAKMHQQNKQNMYGWQEDNFIGKTSQNNKWQKNWSQFFAEQRIGFLLQLLADNGHKLADIDKAVESVHTLLVGHNPQASMLHGDLWQGNTGFYKDQAVIFDPAFYFGDRETDIAMSELFGRFPNEFYQGYNEIWPLESNYQYRKPIYQLYHTLNHALLFEGYYLDSAKSILKNLDS